MDLIKYDMTDIWAVAGDVVAPEGAKIRAGWGVEVVPRQWWNWFENRQDNNIAYMLQKGFPEWDATTEYINNKSYVQRNGVVYKATATTTNSDPVALTSWVRAFTDSTPYLEKLKGLAVVASTIPAMDGSGNATSVPYAATGLQSLNAATPADGRTAIGAQQSNSNLSALSSVTAGANNLPYFTGTTTMGIATLTSFGRSLIDDVDAAAARLTLGLGTASMSDVTTSNLDTTAGRLLKVGDFGLGGATILVADANAISASGLYLCNSTTVNTALVGNGTLVHLQMSGNNASQIYINHPSGRQYNRTSSNGTWSNWIESWTTSNLVKTANQTDSTVGRMLQVGDFGLGSNAIEVASGDVLDINRVNGKYQFQSGCTNLPVAGSGYLAEVSRRSNAGVELYITGATNTSPSRTFSNRYTSGAWQGWVETYTTGNTAQIVSDVQAGIQPQLDAKVSKAGDTMTGTLGVPAIELGQGSIDGRIDFHNVGGNSDYDVRLYSDSAVAGTVGGGRFGVSAAKGMYVNGLITAGNGLNLTGNMFASGAVQAVGLTSSAGLTVSAGTTTLVGVNAGNISSTGSISAAGSVSAANGTISMSSGTVGIRDSNPAGSNVHLWFYNSNGSERGIIYIDPANTMHIRTAGSADALTIASNRNATFGANVYAGGRMQANDVLAIGNVYSGSGNSYLQTNGDVYGGAWGGFLSNWINSNFPSLGGLGQAIVNQTGAGGAIGSYGFMALTGNANVNDYVAGSSLRYSGVNSISGQYAVGTWRCMGYSTNNASLFMRVS